MKKSLGLCCALLMVSCGTESGPVAGGGSDQPNKIQAVRVLKQDGKPAVGARVISWSGTWDPINSRRTTHRLDSGLTDTNGRWETTVPKTGWYVTAQMKDRFALCLPESPEAMLGDMAVVSGRVSSSSGITVDSVWMGGAGEPLLFQRLDSFRLSTQIGPRRIWGRVHWNGGEDTLLLAEKYLTTADDSTLRLHADTGSVLLWSAEAQPLGPSLRGQMFDALDSRLPKAYGNVPSRVLDIQENVTLLMDWGRYYHFPMADSGSVGSSRGLYRVGFPLSIRSLNWTGVDALRIHFVQGFRGLFRVQIGTDRTDALPDGQPLEMAIRAGTWSKDTVMVLRLADFKPAAGSIAEKRGLSWTDVRTGVSRISIEAAQQDVTLELREIRAIGNRWQNW